jgi:hypothetical protein
MKRVSFFLVILIALMSVMTFGQKTTRGFTVVEDLGTQANAAQETVYLDLRSWSRVDSIVVSLSAVGEIDVDTVNFYLGSFTNDGFISDASGGVLYQAVTIDVAAAGTDLQTLLSSNATLLTGVALRGATGIKAVIEIGAAGNDATDPNALYINWCIYGLK